MFVTRATRHDRADLKAYMDGHGRREADVSDGTAFIARDGAVVGCVRLIEVAPQTLVVDDVLVSEERRGEGIGRRIMQAAMNSRGGSLFLCCHPEHVGFYEKLSFKEVSQDDLPAEVIAYLDKVGDIPAPENLSSAACGSARLRRGTCSTDHRFMRAR